MSDAKKTDRKTVQGVFSMAFSRHVGRGRRFSYVDFAALKAGGNPRTVKAWALGETMPGLADFLEIAQLLGVEFANDVLAAAGFSARAISARGGDEFALNADVARLALALAEALMDQRIDHLERPAILRASKKLIAALDAYVGAHGGPA